MRFRSLINGISPNARLICLLLAALILPLGCYQRAARPADSLVAEGDSLYNAYLNGDLAQARTSLQQSVQIGESGKLAPIGQARWLFFDYSRLFLLEKRAGKQDLSQAYLVKARYWYLRQCELRGDSKEEAASLVIAFTDQKCLEFVSKWDGDHTGGKGPKYVREK